MSAWRLRIFVDSPLDSYNIEGMSNRLHKVIVVVGVCLSVLVLWLLIKATLRRLGIVTELRHEIVVGVLLILVLGHRLPKLARSLRDL